MWEYKVRTYTKTRAFETDLNNLGTEGWELVAALTTGEKVRLIFKRLFSIDRELTESPMVPKDLLEYLPNCPIEIRVEQPCK